MSTSDALSPGMQAEMRLRSHFARKRAAERHPCTAPITLRCRHGSLLARAIDVSRVGVLLEPIEAPLAGEGAPETLLDFLCLTAQQFGDGADVRFNPFEDTLRALPVRTVQCTDTGRFQIAFRFPRPVPARLAERLGLRPRD